VNSRAILRSTVSESTVSTTVNRPIGENELARIRDAALLHSSVVRRSGSCRARAITPALRDQGGPCFPLLTERIVRLGGIDEDQIEGAGPAAWPRFAPPATPSCAPHTTRPLVIRDNSRIPTTRGTAESEGRPFA